MMKESLSQKIYKYLEAIIVSDDSNIGDKIPTEIQLCNKFGVGRSSVREAISRLEAQGFVEVRKGSGTYIINKEVKEKNSDYYELNDLNRLDDFMEVRISIETLAVRLFIKKYSEEKLAKVIKAQEEFIASVENGDLNAMSKNDEKFHSLIIEGTENELLIKIGGTLAESFRKYRHRTFNNKEDRNAAITAHNQIIDSLKRRDTNESIYNIHNHLTISKENAKKGHKS